jgi:hypothetical protein
MTVEKILYPMDELEGKVSENVYRLLGVYGMAEMTICFDVKNYTPGREGRLYMPNGDPGYPPEPAEYDLEPEQDYGQQYVGRLFIKAATKAGLARELLSCAMVIPTIVETINKAVDELEVDDEVANAFDSWNDDASNY